MMTAALFQTLRSMDFEGWDIEEIAGALSYGIKCNRIWQKLIYYNNNNPNHPLDVLTNSVLIAFSEQQTLIQMSSLSVSNDFFRNHLSAIKIISGILLASNVTTLIYQLTNKKISDGKDILEKTFIVIWKSTPYLLIITNIALVIVQIRSQPKECSLALAMIGLTLIDITPFKPKEFDWLLDVYLRIPLDLIHLYYAYPEERFIILMGWAQDKKIREIFQRFLQPKKNKILVENLIHL